MKAKARRLRREIFVFTAEEKRAAACVLAALILGLVTMQYRAKHPPLAPKLSAREQAAAQRAAKTASARARSARGQAKVAAAETPPPDDAADEE